MRVVSILLALGLVACGTTNSNLPSLDARPAETIDPRLPIGQAEPDYGTLSVGRQIAEIEASADVGTSAFAALEAETIAAVEARDEQGGEAWTAAQQALSRLDAARQPVAKALGDLDALATDPMVAKQWLTPANREALQAASARIAVVDKRQSDLIDRLTGLLAR